MKSEARNNDSLILWQAQEQLWLAQEQQKEARLSAIALFKAGDRVYNKLTKVHGYYRSPNLGHNRPSCWVDEEIMRDEEMFLDELQPTDPLDLELCHCQSSTSFRELGDLPMPGNILEDSLLPSSLKTILMPSPSLEATGQISLSTPMSETITLQETLMSLPSGEFHDNCNDTMVLNNCHGTEKWEENQGKLADPTANAAIQDISMPSQNLQQPIGSFISKDLAQQILPKLTEVAEEQSTHFLNHTGTSLEKRSNCRSSSLTEPSIPSSQAGTMPEPMKNEVFFTEMSGLTTTDKSPTLGMSTTLTKTNKTTKSAISNVSPKENTPGITAQANKGDSKRDKSHATPKLSEGLIQEKSTPQQKKLHAPLVELQAQSQAQSETELFQQELNGSGSKCLQCLTNLPELEGQQLPGTVLASKQPNSLKSAQTQNLSSNITSHSSPSTTTSELIIPDQESMISIGCHSPAPTHPAPGIEPELTANLVDSGLKPCELSMNANPDLSLSKIPQDYSIEEWEQSFKAYPRAGTFVNGRLSPRQPLERPTLEKGYLLSPTLTSGDSTPNSRAAGQTKCEIWFRKNGLLADSHCLSPQMMALLQGFPKDWTKCLYPSQEEQEGELKADTSMEDVSAPPKLPLRLEESSTSIVSLQELSIDEERDFAHLKRKVESAFIKAELVFRDAVFALKEIRDRKLYRNTYPTFEEYCKVRFGFKRARPYQLINAAVVLENLENSDLQMSTKTEIGRHLLPTNERQIRDLVDLSPEEQIAVWGKAVQGGKIPSGAKIKDTLDAHIRERLNQPPIPTYIEGDVVEIRSGGSSLREHDGMWGIVTDVLPCRYKVYISLRNTEVHCKGDELEKVDEKHTVEIQIVSDRIKKLIALGDLDSSIWWILEGLARQTCFTETQMELLEWVEKRYGVNNSRR